MGSSWPNYRQCLSLWTALFLIGGCDKPAPPAPPPPAVTIAHPLVRDVIEWDGFTGYLESPEMVNVQARVSGLITSALFEEGKIVQKGETLFTIDVRPFQADLNAKIADAAKSAAQVDIAELNFDREAEALKGNAVSKQDYDNAKANLDQAKAELASSQAAVESARLNVEWCTVVAPIKGRVSDKRVTEGNLVNGGAGQATLLTTVQSLNPIYCYVDVDEHTVLKYQKLAVEKKRVSARDAQIPCYIELSNETGYPHAGMIDFVDNHVDPTTGTIRARGVFPNPDGMLTPGFFAKMRVPGSGKYQAMLVPDTAIGNDQSQRNVMVLNSDNAVQVRPVELGAVFGPVRSILSGLSPDDRVIINGQMHVRPGMKVVPTEGTIEVDPSAFADDSTTQPTTNQSGTTQPATSSMSDMTAGTTR